MNWMEAVLFVVVVAIFVATAIVALRGITGKVSVRGRYLGPLVTGLLLENAAAVFLLFQTIDFRETSAVQFVASLPEEVRATSLTDSRDKIRDVVRSAKAVPQLHSEVKALESKVKELESAKAAAAARIAHLEAVERHFLIRLVRFHRDAAEFGNSLNLTYPPHPRKRELARRLLELLAELGHYDGPLEPNPERAKEALIQYQRSRGFSRLGWYSRATFDAMVDDHRAVGLVAQQAAPTDRRPRGRTGPWYPTS